MGTATDDRRRQFNLLRQEDQRGQRPTAYLHRPDLVQVRGGGHGWPVSRITKASLVHMPREDA